MIEFRKVPAPSIDSLPYVEIAGSNESTEGSYGSKVLLRHVISTGIMFLITALCVFGAQVKQDLRSDMTSAAPHSSEAMTTEQKNSGPGFQQRAPRYQLCPSDTFDIVFPLTPEFNQSVTVQPDGYVALTGIGNLDVAGKTVPEVTELLKSSYAAILHDPIINIILKDFQRPYFIASGQLSHPGKYELRSDTTLAEAIAIAGGFTEDSKHSEVLLFRRVTNNWVEIKRVDVKRMFKEANLTEDVHLQPGDMVYVPQNRYSKFKRYIPSPGVGMNVNPY